MPHFSPLTCVAALALLLPLAACAQMGSQRSSSSETFGAQPQRLAAAGQGQAHK